MLLPFLVPLDPVQRKYRAMISHCYATVFTCTDCICEHSLDMQRGNIPYSSTCRPRQVEYCLRVTHLCAWQNQYARPTFISFVVCPPHYKTSQVPVPSTSVEWFLLFRLNQTALNDDGDGGAITVFCKTSAPKKPTMDTRHRR